MDQRPVGRFERAGIQTRPRRRFRAPHRLSAVMVHLVFPLVRGKNELAVALYIYRLRTIQRSRTIKVSNTRLLTELGINRFAKYRALRRLAVAGIITVKSYPQRSLEVVFHRRRSRAK